MKKLLGLVLLILVIASCESDEDKAGRFFLMGNNSLNAGDYKEAIRLYTEAIEKNDKLKEAFNNRGVAYYKDKQYVQAVNDYTHAILQIDAYYMDAWKNRADAHYEAKMYTEALKDLDFLSKAYPDSAWVHFKAGLALVADKQYRRAVNAFTLSLKTDSLNVETIVNKANAFYLANNHNRATATLKQAEAIDPNEPNIYNTYALMAIDKEDYEEALIQLEKAIALDLNNPYFNNNRGFVHLMTGNLEQAEKDINLSIKGNPQNGWAYRNKGIFYFMKDNFESAVSNFQQASFYDDSVPKLNYFWGAALLKQGQTAEGCEKLRLSVDAFENDGRGLFEANCGKID